MKIVDKHSLSAVEVRSLTFGDIFQHECRYFMVMNEVQSANGSDGRIPVIDLSDGRTFRYMPTTLVLPKPSAHILIE